MKILLHSINYAPELTGIGKYTGEMAGWLAARGHEVRVVTAPPYYPQWRIGAGYSNRYARERLDGVDVWRCPLYVPARPSGVRRLLHLASFAFSSFPVMLKQAFWKPDVVITIEPPLFCAPGAWLVARLSGGKCWLHIQDFEVDAAFELGLIPGSWLRWIMTVIECWMMRRFDRVSTISHRMLTKLYDKAVPQSKQVYFPNWVDVHQIHPLDRSSKYRGELGLGEHCVVALYAGNMGEKQGLEVVLAAAEQLRDEATIRFVLCGEGAARARLQEMGRHLPNIHWLPLQPVERLNELLNLADIHLLPQRAGVADLVMPSKLAGMLASGRPVIATANSNTEIAGVMQGKGLVIPPGNEDAFTTALREFAADPELRRKMGEAARQYAVDYLSLEIVLSTFEHDLISCIHPNDGETQIKNWRKLSTLNHPRNSLRFAGKRPPPTGR